MNNIAYVPAKTIITRKKNPNEWFGADYNMNIYKGCCHGCIYCDSRSSCYGIEDFDTVRAKKDALLIIRDELRRKVKTGVVATGAMSDPYNPYEKELALTRHALKLLDAFEFGTAIATKSTLLLRDMDILQGIKEHSPVLCKITITTADDTLAGKIEPGVPVSSQRFAMIKQLSDAGICAGILLMPVLPFLEDSKENVLAIAEKAAQSGAQFIYPAFGMTMRDNQREWYLMKLEQLFPGQGLRKAYEKRYGTYYECRSPKAKALYVTFAEACTKYGIAYEMKDIIHRYKSPYHFEQMTLFGRDKGGEDAAIF